MTSVTILFLVTMVTLANSAPQLTLTLEEHEGLQAALGGNILVGAQRALPLLALKDNEYENPNDLLVYELPAHLKVVGEAAQREAYHPRRRRSERSRIVYDFEYNINELGGNNDHEDRRKRFQRNILVRIDDPTTFTKNIPGRTHERTVEGRERTVEGRERTVEGRERTVEGSKRTVEGSERTVDRSERTVEGSERTVEGSEQSVEPAVYNVDVHQTGQRSQSGQGSEPDKPAVYNVDVHQTAQGSQSGPRSRRQKPTSNAESLGFAGGTIGGLFGSSLGKYVDSTSQATVQFILSLANLGTLILDQVEDMVAQENATANSISRK